MTKLSDGKYMIVRLMEKYVGKQELHPRKLKTDKRSKYCLLKK